MRCGSVRVASTSIGTPSKKRIASSIIGRTSALVAIGRAIGLPGRTQRNATFTPNTLREGLDHQRTVFFLVNHIRVQVVGLEQNFGAVHAAETTFF